MIPESVMRRMPLGGEQSRFVLIILAVKLIIYRGGAINYHPGRPH